MARFRTSQNRRIALVAVAIALVPAIAGCQSVPPAKSGTTPPAAASSRQGELSAELMYRLLIGDIALQRGDAALAARAYLEAARDSRDVRIARRATEVAIAARQRDLAIQSAKVWSELDPTAERPKLVISGLVNAGPGAAGDARAFANDLKGELARALAEAAANGARLGEAFMQLNRMLESESDHAASFRLIKSLAQPYPTLPEAQFAVALAAYNTGLSDFAIAAAALEAIDRTLALKPGWDQAVALKAEILSKQSPDKAAEYLVEFLKANPDSKVAISALVQVRVQQKRYADAYEILSRLYEKDKSNHEYAFGMAMLAIQTKDWAKAESLLEELKKADYGEEGTVDFYLAQIAEESGRYELALERYRAVNEGERGWVAKLRAASMMAKLNRVDEARKYLADLPAVTIEQRVQVKQTEAQLLRDANRADAAYAVLTEALVALPEEPDLLYDLAMIAEKLDKLDVAEAKLKRLIELKPGNAQALNALGYTLVDRTTRVEEGLALIERALELAPDDPFILDSIGWAQFRLGRLDAAEKYLRQALEQRADPEIAAHLGEVLWAKGDRVRAQDVWQLQLKSTPDNAVLLETVRRLTR